MLWRVKAGLTLPVLALLPDGPYSPVLVNPKIRGKAREALLAAARSGEDLDEDQARYVRVVDHGTRHSGPATIKLVCLELLTRAA